MAIIPGLENLDPIIQDNTLQRIFLDSLYAELLFRSEAKRELWEAQQGDRLVKTKVAGRPVTLAPVPAGEDPQPKSNAYEQWSILACQYGDAVDTQMPVSRAALASKFASDARELAKQAGQSMNRLVRNKLFNAYVGGTTHADNGITGTAMEVGSINGFTTLLDTEGQEQTVSPQFPKNITFGATSIAAVVIGATLADAAFPLGRGTLTLQASATWVAGDVVKADDAPAQVYAGAGVSSDGLTDTDFLDLASIRQAVAILRANSVPPHEDGSYHIHPDPFAVSQIYSDNEWQRVSETRFDAAPYQEFFIAKLLGCYMYSNSLAPGVENATGAVQGTLQQVSRPADAADAVHAGEINADVRNKGDVKILRTIVTGAGSIYERFIPEGDYLTEAGVNGKVGQFQQISVNGMAVNLDGIRYILRAPQDRFQQIVGQAWSWSGDWGIPSDKLGGRTTARFKRAVVINSGTNG